MKSPTKSRRRRSTPRAVRVHLVRHGEVHNPDHLVYGLLPGWHLSERGLAEARNTAGRLAETDIAAIYSSPLERAVATARTIADATGAPLSTDDRLVEWRLGEHWGGMRWEDVETGRPEEWRTYLTRPDQIDFIEENLARLADRMAEAITAIARGHEGSEIAFVSHSDPIKAAVLRLTGSGLDRLHSLDVPTGGVLTLDITAGRASVPED